jgi:hypothetical protein
MKKRLMIYSSVLVILSTTLLCFKQQADQETFVLKKQKVTASRSQLKEQNVQALADLLQQLPSTLKSLANLQEASMGQLCSYVEGEKGCFWVDASREELNLCLDRLQQCFKQVVALEEGLKDNALFLKQLYKKDKKLLA